MNIINLLPSKLLSVLICLYRLDRPVHIREVARLCRLSPRGASLLLNKLSKLQLLNCSEVPGLGSRRRKYFSLIDPKALSPDLEQVAKIQEAGGLQVRAKIYDPIKSLFWIDETLQIFSKIKANQ